MLLAGHIFFLLTLVFSQDSAGIPFYSYEVITPKELKSKGEIHGMDVSYVIMAEGKQYVLHLKRKLTLITSSFSVYTYPDRRRWLNEVPYIKDDCYYNGFVEGFPNSIVGLSTCSGLSGFVHDRNFSYVIEPVQPFLHFKHLIYPVENNESFKCGMKNTSIGRNLSLKMVARRTNAAYLELFVVVTQPLFDFYLRNETSLLQHITGIINIVDTIYRQENANIVLVGIEIWTKGNQINTHVDDPEAMLSNFSQWKVKHLDSRVKCDAAVLVLKESLTLVSGLTNSGGACHPATSTLFVVFSSTNVLNSALQMSHEIGHLLGMHHDNPNKCACDRRLLCLMDPNGKITVGISECSKNYLDFFLNSEASFCLWNRPSTESSQAKTPTCGNKRVDKGEDCDCGFVQECTNVCCDPRTCRLNQGAECATGKCCLKCQLAVLGTACRIPISECDLAEYCDGISSSCPPDVYAQDGTPCNNNVSICYKESCYDYTKHCKRIFGEGSNVASPECFVAVNTIGDRFGNCAIQKGTKKCMEKDAMCGRVQCQNVKKIHLPNLNTSIIETPLGRNWCWGVDSSLQGQGNIGDLGFVPDGAKCGDGKVCLNKACVDDSVLLYDCDVKIKCYGHGVCNSNKNCHCDRDWAPPDCVDRGFGGSIDSGPLTKGSFISYTSPVYKSSAPGYSNIPLRMREKSAVFSVGVSMIMSIVVK